MRMEDDVDAPDGVDLDGHVDMEMDCDDEEEEDEEEDDKDEENEEEKEEEEDEEDEDEDDGHEPRMIHLGELANASADDVDTIVDDQPLVSAEQGQEMRNHTSEPQSPAPAPWAHTLEPRPWPRTPETSLFGGLDFLWLVMLQQPRPAVPTPQPDEAARYTLDPDVGQQLLGESAGVDSLPYVPHPHVPLCDFLLPDVCLDGSVGEE